MAKANTVKTPASKPVKSGKVLKDVSKPEAPANTVTDLDLQLAGFTIGTAEGSAIATLRKLASGPVTEDMVKHARRCFIVGYLAATLGTLSPETIATASALYDGTASTAAKAKEGTIQRTAEQDRVYGAGKQRWSRAARLVGLEQKHGNAGNTSAQGANKRAEETPEPKTEAPKAEPKAEPVGKVEDVATLFKRAHEVKEGLKALSNPAKAVLAETHAEVFGLYIAALEHVNRFELALARLPK